MNKHMRRIMTATSVLTLVALTGCAPQQAQTKSGAGTHQTTGGNNRVSVAYAGSLQYVNDTALGPAFTKATGIAYQGRGGGSLGMAHLIASGEISPDVFESVGTAPLQSMGDKSAKWAIGFASSPLVVAYSPSSPYAPELRDIADGRKPLSALFGLMRNPDFHLGRTNPATDPQGQSFILMMQLAEQQLHLPAGTAKQILGSNDNSNQIFAEESILSRLQAGQLDATSAYLPEAIQHHLPYIALPPSMNLGDPAYAKTYASVHLTLDSGKMITGRPIEIYVTTVPGNSNPVDGESFVSFLLSTQGQNVYKANGFAMTTPFQIWGDASQVPPSVRAELKG